LQSSVTSIAEDAAVLIRYAECKISERRAKVPTIQSFRYVYPAIRCESAPLSSLVRKHDEDPETLGIIADRSCKERLKIALKA